MLIAILFFLGLGGMLFVPEKIVPVPVWPLSLGIILLGMVVFRVIKAGTFPDAELGPALAAVLFSTLGIALILNKGDISVSILVSLIVTLLAGAAWAAWRAFRKRSI